MRGFKHKDAGDHIPAVIHGHLGLIPYHRRGVNARVKGLEKVGLGGCAPYQTGARQGRLTQTKKGATIRGYFSRLQMRHAQDCMQGQETVEFRVCHECGCGALK